MHHRQNQRCSWLESANPEPSRQQSMELVKATYPDAAPAERTTVGPAARLRFSRLGAQAPGRPGPHAQIALSYALMKEQQKEYVHVRGYIDAEADMLSAEASSAMCVQRFDDSRNSAIHITYRSSLRSSSLREPRYPLLRVVLVLVRACGQAGGARFL